MRRFSPSRSDRGRGKENKAPRGKGRNWEARLGENSLKMGYSDSQRRCFLLAKQEKLAEGFLTTIRSLPKRDRELVLLGLVKDRNLRHDLIDLAIIEERRKEPSRPFREYLKSRKRQA